MLQYSYFFLSLKPIEKCRMDVHHCFQWESVFCEKKNKRWTKFNKIKMEFAQFLLTLKGNVSLAPKNMGA